MIDSKTTDAGPYPALGPAPWVCSTCSRFMDLNGEDASTVSQRFGVERGVDYIVSMWVSADYQCQGNRNDPALKTARIMWDDEIIAELAIDVTGWDKENYRWKLYSWEVRAGAHVANLKLQSTNTGCGGVLIDEVSVRMAHAGTIDGITGGECAVLGTDYTVELVEKEVLHNFGMRDTYMMESLICSVDGVFPPWYECDAGVVGVITDETETRYYTSADESFVHTFGGTSEVMDEVTAKSIMDSNMDTSTNIMACSQGTFATVEPDPMAPWYNPYADTDKGVAVFRGPATDGDVTVFTYKLQFDHIATILNIKVTGAKFEGSVFRLSTHARTPISTREVNLNDGHFNDDCDRCGVCEVIVPGSPHTAELTYFFEEQSAEAFGRIRASFCVRTPVCLLHGENEMANIDPHTKVPTACGDECACTDGLFEHLDTYDGNFRTQ